MLLKNPSNFGRLGENFAVKFLQERGYKIISQNFHSRFGEIDIIALLDDTLVFIEVKARWSKKFGAPEEAVTEWKLSKIIKTANYFSLINPNLPKKMRIEVVALEVEGRKVTSCKLIRVGA